MTLDIISEPARDLSIQIKKLYLSKPQTEVELTKETIENVKKIFSDREIRLIANYINDLNMSDSLSYNDMAKLEETSRILSKNLSEIKEHVDLEMFFKKGYNLDVSELKKLYVERKLKEEFPNLNFEKIKQIYVTPPKYLETYYNDNLKIDIDSFVFRKYVIGVIQMVFNHMDLVICNIGDEGAGKSCKCSQDMYILWWIMTEIGLITYEFKLKDMFANTLKRFSDLEDTYYSIPFRIIGLDEGNELNRQDWKEDEVKLFWQRLRRERHERRIKFINIPVLGEMILNIVLSRVNFIFNMLNRNTPKTATLYKGDYDFYIIPRGDKIYSPYLNKDLTKEEIKNKLYMNLKDKEYLKGIPKDIRIKKCHCNGVWAFKEKEYIKEMKESNKTYRIGRSMRFGLMELYAFFKSGLTLRQLGINKLDYRYASMNLMIHKINKFWRNDPELLMKYDFIAKTKQENKEHGRKTKIVAGRDGKKDFEHEAAPNLEPDTNR